MSRIENAMEKAASLRQQGVQTPVPLPETTPVSNPESVPPSLSAPSCFPMPERAMTPSSPFLVTLLDPRSPAAEEYRKLKALLVKLTQGEIFKNTVMVTSSVPNEGKSLTALNLAITLAQELDHTVLLLDADLRRPSLHRYLEIEQGVGLSDVLLGEADLADAILPTGIGKLALLRAGRPVDGPAELFSSQRMKALVQEMKHRYPDRYIICDAPPLLPFAETRSLAHLVDGVLFVVMERLAPQAKVKEALDSLKGCELLGLVYNAALVDRSDERYNYYRSYDTKKH